MIDMRNICSESEFAVRKEFTGFLKKNFEMSQDECFLWVTSRMLDGGEGFTVATPFKGYVRKYLLDEMENGRHFMNDVELALLSEAKNLLNQAFSSVDPEDAYLVKSYYFDHIGMSELVGSSEITFGQTKRVFRHFHEVLKDCVSTKKSEYTSVDGSSVLNLRIGWKSKSLLWKAGIHSVEELNTCFYTGSKDVGKILNKHQLYIVSDALKNLETV